MAELTIKTNNVPRLLLDWDQLTPKEQAEFDYLDSDDVVDRDFVRYRGWVYDLGEFVCPQSRDMFPGWEAYRIDSYSSGVLFRYAEHDRDRVIMATYYS